MSQSVCRDITRLVTEDLARDYFSVTEIVERKSKANEVASLLRCSLNIIFLRRHIYDTN